MFRRGNVRVLTRVGIGTALLLGLCTSPLGAGVQNDEKARPAIVFEHSGFNNFLVDEKDAVLKRAFSMVPQRLMELRQEVPDLRKIPEPVFSLLFDFLPRPTKLVVSSIVTDPDTDKPTASVILAFRAESSDDALAMTQHVYELLKSAGSDVPLSDSPSEINTKLLDTPAGPIAFGPVQIENHWWFRAAFGPAFDVSSAFDALAPAPDGMNVVSRGMIDMRAFSPVLSMILGSAGGREGQMGVTQLTDSGLLGPDAISVDFTAGYTADSFVIHNRVNRLRLAKNYGSGKETLSEADFRVIPADASVATLSKWDPASLWNTVETMADYGMFDLDEVRTWCVDNLGADPLDDILVPLGSTWVWYSSDTTGADSILSGVLVVSIDQPKRLHGAINEIVHRTNQELDRIGYVEIAKVNVRDRNLYVLRTPGLPFPVEISFALAGDHLVAGFTPQAVVAAVNQVASPGKSILDNPRFARSFPRSKRGSMLSYSFLDTEKLAPCGYPLLQLVGSAISNGVRSPRTARDPGVVMPPWNQFIKGVRPITSYSYWDDNDLVQIINADHSVLVNKSAAVGYIGRSPVVLGIIGGAAMGGFLSNASDLDFSGPAYQQSPSQTISDADTDNAMSQIRRLGQFWVVDAIDNDTTADSLQVLIDHGYFDNNGKNYPSSPFADAASKDCYVFRPACKLNNLQKPWRAVAAYDRPMLSKTSKVVVLFADGHVEFMRKADFYNLVGSGENAGIDWHLP